jgi:hypothetical protein
MKKMSIYIDPEVDWLLTRRAKRERTTKAALIRAALAEAAAVPPPLPYGCGIFKGPGDLATNVDKYLAETGFGED